MHPLTIGDALISGLILGYGHKLGSQVGNVQDMTKALLDNLPDVLKVSEELREKLQLTELRYRPRLNETLVIDLSTARSKEKFEVTGSCLLAQEIDGTLEVRFNEQDNDPVTINSSSNRTCNTDFDTLYISNSAQAGKSVTFLIGKAGAFLGSVITPMTFNAQIAGVYLNAEWQTKEGNDKNFNYYGADVATAGKANGSYQVPSGKTLYITAIEAHIYASTAADRDLAQHFLAEVYDDDSNFKVQFGGDGGGTIDLSRPLVVDAGNTVNFYIRNYSNHNCDIGISAQGYEI